MATARAPILEPMKLAWSRSPAPAFLRWWGTELAAVLPGPVRAWLLRGPDVLWLDARPAGLRVRRGRTGEVLADIPGALAPELQRTEYLHACAGTAAEDRRLVVVMPPAAVLRRRLVLPAAAAADPRRVVGYELDRQTPFQAGQLYYDVRAGATTVPRGQVAMDLYAVPRTELDALLERLAAIGLRPDAVDVEVAANRLAGVDLLPAARRPHRVDRRRRLNWLLAGACVALAGLVLGQWLANRRAALATMQDEVAAMRTQATRSAQLRAELAAAITGSKFLAERKQDSASPLTVLATLTRQLPADAWLDQLTLDDAGGLDIQGEASHAAALVDALGNTGILQQPRLQGVIQPDPATGKERFELVARVPRAGAGDAH